MSDDPLYYFDKKYACSTSMLMAYAKRYNLDDAQAKRLSSTFGGGMGRLRKTCGALTGAMMVIGLEFGNEEPEDMDTKLAAYDKVQDLFVRFQAMHGTTDCETLISRAASADEVEERKHHQLICRKVIADANSILKELLES